MGCSVSTPDLVGKTRKKKRRVSYIYTIYTLAIHTFFSAASSRL